MVDDLRLKDIPQRYPVEEPQERLQRRFDQARLVRLLQNFIAQIEDLRELAAHALLQVLRLRLRHLFCREVENLF